jgi:hypothetical protein
LNGRKQGGKPKCPRDTNITTFCRTLGSIACTKKNPLSSNNARENHRYIPRTHVVPCPRPVPPGGNRSLRQANMPSEPAPNVLHSMKNGMGPSSLPPPVLQAESRADEWRLARFAREGWIMEIGAMLILPILVRGLRKCTLSFILYSRSDLLNTMTIGPPAVYMLART